MFRITTKVKVAGGLTAGALILGGAAAYAANAGTLTAATIKPVTIEGAGTNSGTTLVVLSLDPNASSPVTAPAFNSKGACISWFAQNRKLALPTSLSGSSLRKNYHGKLMSSALVRNWCDGVVNKTQAKAQQSDTPDATESQAPEAPDATQSDTPETDTGDKD